MSPRRLWTGVGLALLQPPALRSAAASSDWLLDEDLPLAVARRRPKPSQVEFRALRQAAPVGNLTSRLGSWPSSASARAAPKALEEAAPRGAQQFLDATAGDGEEGAGLQGSTGAAGARDVRNNSGFQNAGGQPDRMGICLMALSLVVTLMPAPYFGLHPDKTTRSHALQFFSTTGGIFSSVMLFNGLTSALKDWLDPISRLLLAALLTTLAYAAVWAFSTLRGVTAKGVERSALATKTFGSTAMHLAAFAWVPVWTDVGALLAAGGASWSAWVVSPLAAGIFLLGSVATACADWRRRNNCGQAEAEAAKAPPPDLAKERDAEDEKEEEQHEEAGASETALDLARQCEEEGAGVLLSILAMQQSRDAIKHLVDFDETDAGTGVRRYSVLQITIVMLAGAATMAVFVALLKYLGPMDRRGPPADALRTCAAKMLSVLVKGCMFYTGWASLVAVQWFLLSYFIRYAREKIVLYIVVALLSSYYGYGLLVGINKLGTEDDPPGVEITRTVVKALGVMAGYSWQRCASLATDQLAALSAAALLGAGGAGGGGLAEGGAAFTISLLVCCTTLAALLLEIVPRSLQPDAHAHSKEHGGSAAVFPAAQEQDSSLRPLLQRKPLFQQLPSRGRLHAEQSARAVPFADSSLAAAVLSAAEAGATERSSDDPQGSKQQPANPPAAMQAQASTPPRQAAGSSALTIERVHAALQGAPATPPKARTPPATPPRQTIVTSKRQAAAPLQAALAAQQVGVHSRPSAASDAEQGALPLGAKGRIFKPMRPQGPVSVAPGKQQPTPASTLTIAASTPVSAAPCRQPVVGRRGCGGAEQCAPNAGLEGALGGSQAPAASGTSTPRTRGSHDAHVPSDAEQCAPNAGLEGALGGGPTPAAFDAAFQTQEPAASSAHAPDGAAKTQDFLASSETTSDAPPEAFPSAAPQEEKEISGSTVSAISAPPVKVKKNKIR